MGLLRWLAGWAGRWRDGTPLVFVLLLFTVLTFILAGERVVVVKTTESFPNWWLMVTKLFPISQS